MNARRLFIAVGFLALMAVGALLLAMPFSRVAGTFGSASDALFMACSAVCVTGLSVVDVGAEYTRAGQIVLLALVEVGCLGLMTCGTFLLVAIGRRLSLDREFSLMNAYGVAKIRGVRSLILWVVGTMLVVESLGFLALYARLHDVYESIYYSVMSFCNAGFSLRADSLAAFQDDPLALLVMGLETILGGIGFLVVYNLCTFRFLRRPSGARGRLSLHSRVVLCVTAILLLVGALLFLACEWSGALAAFPLSKKLAVSLYQSVTPRTCGFSLVPMESLQPVTRLVIESLMFVGGAPGSAAAGIKVTTFAVLVCTLTALWRGEEETVVFRRALPYDVVRESLVIVTATALFIAFALAALLITERGRSIATDALFFEAVSAITTTGLSVGETTRELSHAGRLVVMCAMFVGRLGALSVVMMIGARESRRPFRYPTGELVVG